MFSLNSGMNNLDQLSFLDKIQWKLAKQLNTAISIVFAILLLLLLPTFLKL